MSPKLRLYILGGSMAATVPIYLLMAWIIVKQGKGAPMKEMDPQTLQILLAVFMMVGLSSLGAAFFFKTMIGNLHRAGKLAPERELPMWIIVFTCCDVPALMGLFLLIFSSNINLFYIFACISLMAFGFFWPRKTYTL